MCLVSFSSASALPLYFLAVSLKDGPSFFLSTAWHLRQSLFFSRAWAASASTAACAAEAAISPAAAARVRSNFISVSCEKNHQHTPGAVIERSTALEESDADQGEQREADRDQGEAQGLGQPDLQCRGRVHQAAGQLAGFDQALVLDRVLFLELVQRERSREHHH